MRGLLNNRTRTCITGPRDLVELCDEKGHYPMQGLGRMQRYDHLIPNTHRDRYKQSGTSAMCPYRALPRHLLRWGCLAEASVDLTLFDVGTILLYA